MRGVEKRGGGAVFGCCNSLYMMARPLVPRRVCGELTRGSCDEAMLQLYCRPENRREGESRDAKS